MAINGTPKFTAYKSGAFDSQTLNGSGATAGDDDNWTTPASGDIIIAGVSVRSDTVGAISPSWPSGFNVVHGGSATGNGACKAEVAWKVSDGSETELTVSVSNRTGGFTAAACVFSPTDLTASIEASSEDETNLGGSTTSQTIGAISNTTPAALCIAIWMGKIWSAWKDVGYSVDGSYNEVLVADPGVNSGVSSHPGLIFATKVVSSAASQAATFSTSDTGTTAYGVGIIFGGSVVLPLSAYQKRRWLDTRLRM